MSWLFSQALVEEYSQDICSDGELSVQSSGSPTQLAYCALDKMTKFSRLSRFGMTFKPLTASHGEELCKLYREAFLAKILVQQEKAQESPENEVGCGEKWRALLGKYDRNTRSWKTAQCSLFEDLELSLETFPRWGSMRNGECWERQTLVQTIRGTESGLSENKKLWPTPCLPGNGGTNGKAKMQKMLAEKWPTPDANCGQRGTQPNWTPKRKSGQPAQYTINQAVRDKMFRTPTAHNAKECNSPSEKNRNTPTLATHAGGKLNPDWVEWLMNWPNKWSDLNVFDPKEFERWQKTSATPLQKSVQMRTMWWNRDPSQTSHRSQHEQQQEQQHCDSLHQVSRVASCESTMERSHEGQDLPVLRDSVHLQTIERKNLQSGMWKQTCMDETQIVPRVGGTGIATVDRLKAIGNGQVPLCAATAWRILTESNNDDK